MRHTAFLTLAAALGLAACEPVPPRPELSPVIAPVGAGVGLPSSQPPSGFGGPPGVFSPDPPGQPIIEETLTDVPGELISRPTDAPLDPSIAAAVDAAEGTSGASGTVDTAPEPQSDPFAPLPQGGTDPADPFAPGPTVTPLPDAPLGTVPGGPLPDPQYRRAPEPRTPGWDDASAAGVPVTPVAAGADGISREQDFEAVQDRSIALDAERLAALRASRREVAPEPVPTRPAAVAPNIVGYALQARNAVGQPVYRRGGLRSLVRRGDPCVRFSSDDRAQEAFLVAGGPARDRHGLDPDGDGFACGWDPAPFRNALN